MSQLIFITGPPLAGKDHIATALCHLLGGEYAVLRPGQMFRKYLGVQVFIEEDSPYGPEWADHAILQMLRYATEKHNKVICVGVPRNRRQVAFVRSYSGSILWVSGDRWSRHQTDAEDKLTELATENVTKSKLFQELVPFAKSLGCPSFDINNRFRIDVPGVGLNEVDVGELWRVVEPTLPSRVVDKANE